MGGKKVDFIVVGAQKSGTSALHHYLLQHPELSLSNVKEVHYFDNESEFLSEPNYDNYHKFFTEFDNNKLHGELTPIYIYWRESIRRIYEYNKKMKIIIVLRNPIHRAYSHWNMERSKDKEWLSFYEALTIERLRLEEALPLQHRVFSYVDRGYYSKQIKNVWKYFKKENVLILRHELLKYQAPSVLSTIAGFLEISDFPNIENANVHQGDYNAPMNSESRKYLIEAFKNEIHNIEEMLHWNCKEWLLEPDDA